MEKGIPEDQVAPPADSPPERKAKSCHHSGVAYTYHRRVPFTTSGTWTGATPCCAPLNVPEQRKWNQPQSHASNRP